MKSRWAMRSCLRAEEGWLVATAIILMTLMMGMGLATYAIVDTQTALSGVERQRESSFNLGESALNAQAFSLSRRWPGTATNPYPASCTWTTGQTVSLDDDRCPSASELERAFDTADYASATSWTVTVRDDDGVQFYDRAEIDGNPRWDANDNDALWVRADAVVRGKSRALVALVSVERVTESFPRKAVVAGSIEIGPSGNQTYVQTGGQDVALRCSKSEGSSCVYYTVKKSSQIAPEESIKYGQYVGESVLTPEAIDRLRAFAKASGTYYTSCPTSPAGEVVFVEPQAPSTACKYNASGRNFNSSSDPGVFILTRGTFNIGGNDAYYGIVYALNGQGYGPGPPRDPPVVSTRGGGEIHGAVFIDGAGRLEVDGSSTVIYDSNAFENVNSYGAAGVVQNTWRELPSP